MKAAFLTAPRTLELREIPDVTAPPDGVVLDIKACGICGSDLRRWKEGPPAGRAGMIPGHEAAGIVVEAGADQSRFAVGDRIAIAPDVHCGRCYYCRRGLYNLCDGLRFIGITPELSGALAEKLVLTAEILTHGIVHRMPEGMSFAEGSLAEPSCSVLASHERAGTGLGDTVVVMGASAVNKATPEIIIAKARGAAVIVSEPSPVRRRLAERCGSDAIVDPTAEDLGACVRRMTASSTGKTRDMSRNSISP